MGVRQFRHPLQGVRAARSAAHPAGEARRRRAGPRAHRRGPDRRPAHPLGRGRRLRGSSPSTPRSAASGSARSTPTSSRTTTTSSARSPTPTRRCAARPSGTCWSASTSWTRPARAISSCGSPTAPTTPARTTSAARQDRLAEALAAVYDRLGDDQRMLLEYKFFEPAFYATDVPDWGTAYAHCLKLGPKAQVVVDTGHHAPGHQHRVHRRAAAARGEARRASTSTPASTPTTT